MTFCFNSVVYKMNEIVNRFLLAGNKFMPEICLKQPGFSYSASGPFTRNKERVETYIQTANTDHICRDDPDKACVQYDMAYGKYIDLTKRTQSDKFLKDKAFEIATNPKYDGYQRGLPSMIYKFFDKKSTGSYVNLMSNQQLLNELHKPII